MDGFPAAISGTESYLRRDAHLSESVKIWRDTFKLNLRIGFREDIISTVTDLELWKSLLAEWKEKKWNPLSVKEQLSEYERRTHSKLHQRISIQESLHTRLPERRDFDLPDVQQRKGIELRASGNALDEILAQALFRLQSNS